MMNSITPRTPANQADALGYNVGPIMAHINLKVGEVLTDIKTNQPGVLAQILADDVAKLNAIIAAPTTPAITRAVITEVLANIGDVNLTEGAPGARHTNAGERGRGINEKYTVYIRFSNPAAQPSASVHWT